jgi:hypothetical protein
MRILILCPLQTCPPRPRFHAQNLNFNVTLRATQQNRHRQIHPCPDIGRIIYNHLVYVSSQNRSEYQRSGLRPCRNADIDFPPYPILPKQLKGEEQNLPLPISKQTSGFIFYYPYGLLVPELVVWLTHRRRIAIPDIERPYLCLGDCIHQLLNRITVISRPRNKLLLRKPADTPHSPYFL